MLEGSFVGGKCNAMGANWKLGLKFGMEFPWVRDFSYSKFSSPFLRILLGSTIGPNRGPLAGDLSSPSKIHLWTLILETAVVR